MTREEFIKHKWKAYEVVWIKYPHWEWAAEFMVAGTNFDNETIDARPFEDIFLPNDGCINIKFCHFKNPTPDKIIELKKV